jgi:membrane protease YdiL (CAAX protease family)
LLPLALAFYAAMGAAAVAWRLLSDGQGPFFASRGGVVPGGGLLLWHLLLGLAAGGGLIAVSRLWVHYTRMGRALAQHLAEILGPLSGASVAMLALASGLGEEVFFRGALQPRVGLVIASLLFGLAHLVPRRELAPWAGFAVLAGVLLGALFEYTGNLLAPATAHVLVNGVNLRWLSRASALRSTPGGTA